MFKDTLLRYELAYRGMKKRRRDSLGVNEELFEGRDDKCFDE